MRIAKRRNLATAKLAKGKKIEFNRAEEELKRLSSVVDAMVDGVTITDLHGKITYINRAVTEQLGYEKEEIIGKLPTEFMAEKDKPKFAAEAKKVLFDKSPPKYSEYLAKRKDGTEIPISAKFSVLRDPNGRPRKIVAVSRDITERKRAEEALQESEKRFRELADLLPQTVFEIDLEGNFTFANRHGFESSGYTQEDLGKGLNALQLFIPEDRGRVKENIRRILSGEKSSGNEYTVLRKDGSTFPAIIYSSAIIREGKPVGLRGVAIDLTERKKAEEEKLKANKQRIEELEKLMDVAVGRELEMIELKDRIRALELKLKEIIGKS